MVGYVQAKLVLKLHKISNVATLVVMDQLGLRKDIDLKVVAADLYVPDSLFCLGAVYGMYLLFHPHFFPPFEILLSQIRLE